MVVNPPTQKLSLILKLKINREIMDKYFDDLEQYENDLYCSECGNDSKSTFVYSRTVANGEVWYCKRCKTENLTLEKPNEDNY